MAEDKTFCKLAVDYKAKIEVKRDFFVVGFWKADSFELRFTDGKNVWVGRASERLVRDKLWPHGSKAGFMSHQDFVSLMRAALVSPTVGTARFGYALDPVGGPNSAMLFQCRIRLDGDDEDSVDWIQCEIEVVQESNQADQKVMMQEILTWLIEREASSNALVDGQMLEFDRMRNDLDLLEKHTAQMTQDKTRMELELYEKYVVVLNRKKQKVKALQSELEELRKLPRVKEEQKPNGSQNTKESDAYENEDADGGSDEDDDNSGLGSRQESLPLSQLLTGMTSPGKSTQRPKQRKRLRQVAGVGNQEAESAAMPPPKPSRRVTSKRSSQSISRKSSVAKSKTMNPPPAAAAAAAAAAKPADASADAMDLIQDFE